MCCSNDGYRFGFNGQEKDNEIKGVGNSLDFGARIYDSRLGRFLSVDPWDFKYPYQSTYVFAHNSPIKLIDYLGLGDPPKSSQEDANKYIASQVGNLKKGVVDIDANVLLSDLQNQINCPDGSFSQGDGTNFCSKAAGVSSILATNDPLGYAKFVIGLYSNGSASYNGLNYQFKASNIAAINAMNYPATTGHPSLSPASKLAFTALTQQFNFTNGGFDYFGVGDEASTEAGTFAGTFTNMVKSWGYDVDQNGSTVGTMPYYSKFFKTPTMSPSEFVNDLSSKINQGTVIMLVNGPNLRNTGNWLIPTHYIVLKNIELNGNNVNITYWDYGSWKPKTYSANRLMESIHSTFLIK